MVHTLTLRPGCEQECLEVSRIQAVYIRDVRANRRCIIKSKNMHSDGYGNSSGQEYDTNGRRKERRYKVYNETGTRNYDNNQ
jgi:hypothetical protein